MTEKDDHLLVNTTSWGSNEAVVLEEDTGGKAEAQTLSAVDHNTTQNMWFELQNW